MVFFYVPYNMLLDFVYAYVVHVYNAKIIYNAVYFTMWHLYYDNLFSFSNILKKSWRKCGPV